LTGLNATGAIFGFDVPSNTWRFGMGSQQTDLLVLPRVASGEDIDALDTRLIQTGYGLSVHVRTLSGNLTATGQIAQNNALNLSGSINASGRRAWDDAINLSGRLFATGALIAGVSGGLQVQINSNDSDITSLSNRITLTGQNSRNDSLNLSGRLTQTGVLIGSEIDALSGVVNVLNNYSVWTTGNQTSIAGEKTFTTLINISQGGASGLKFIRASHDTYGLHVAGSKGLFISNVTDGRDEMVFDGAGNVGVGTISPTYKLEVNGSFAAASKSFIIPHPIYSGKRLQHGVVEGPEHSVFIRGRLVDSGIIQLPDYWAKMVDENSVTVQLTPIGKYQKLYVENVSLEKISIKNDGLFDKRINCYYYIQGERTDIDRLKVEV
jgi:hypothetical protein